VEVLSFGALRDQCDYITLTQMPTLKLLDGLRDMSASVYIVPDLQELGPRFFGLQSLAKRVSEIEISALLCTFAAPFNWQRRLPPSTRPKGQFFLDNAVTAWMVGQHGLQV
jgi:hypothetical protein